MASHAGTVVLEPATRSARTRPTPTRGEPRTVREPRPARRDNRRGVILEALPALPILNTQAAAHTDPARREPTREEIQLRAYEIYLARGRADGHDLDDWLQAERELRALPRA